MNFKKRINGSWVDTPNYIHNTSTDTITTLPAVVYANGTTATVGLKGNMPQTGTPTPQNPVMPEGCGNKTGNLINISTFQDGMHLDVTTGLPTSFGGRRIATMQPIDVSQYNNITVTYDELTHSALFMYSIFNGDTLIERVANKSSGYTIDTSNATKMYLSLYPCILPDINYIMGNTGSEPLPYEPYGIKIPILSNSTTTPVYLGEVESVRYIKKLVLTGQEDIRLVSGNAPFKIMIPDMLLPTTNNVLWVCSHYESVPNNATWINYNTMISWSTGDVGNSKALRVRDVNLTTLEDFKTYLQQQYANGTPVTVWYVLVTEETGIVNEPLMKIGEYADTVSGITIPTIAGANAVDVLTTLKPSEVTVNYKGWHPVSSVHERESGAWD